MGAPQYEQAGADIGGSGTTNTIPRWTGASTLGDSGLIDNGTAIYTTTRSVCINTTNARTSRFSVEQTGTGTKLATFSNAVDADFEIKSASAGLLTIGTGTGTLAIQSGGTERMRVSNSGVASASQVAIGTGSFTSGCSLTVMQSIDVSQSAQGLKLPATPGNPDTQTLDAYQEMGSGTYVASTATLTCGTSGTITLKTTSDQNKLYVTRIGRTVHVSGFLVVDSVSSPTGRLTITTSPALPAVQNGAGANIVFTGPTGLVAGDLIQPTISASTIFCDVYNGGVQSQTGAAKMQANTSLWVSFSYHAA